MSAFEGKADLRFHCEMSANAHPIADMLQLYQRLQLGRLARVVSRPTCDQSENGFETEWRDVPDRVIEFPYLVMFRNENGHFVSVGGGSEFKTEKEATAKAREEKCDELKTTVYVMEAVELYEPGKKSNK
jgi:hypothetical protein